MARRCILLGWVSRPVWHSHSHMPIRYLWLLITSHSLGLHCSGSHTWLHLYYTHPPATLIWLCTLLGLTDHVTTDWKTWSWTQTSNGNKHDPKACQFCFSKYKKVDNRDYSIVRYLCEIQQQLCSSSQRISEWVSNTGYPENLKKEKLLSC